MKSLVPVALGICAIVGCPAFAAEPVQPPLQPLSSLPPSSLPPGSPAPVTPPGVGVGHKNPETEGPITTDSNALRSDAQSREAEKIKNVVKSSHSFANAAAQDGMLEIELGKLAVSKGSNQQIRDFGKHMAVDHEKANGELKKVARAVNVTLSTKLDDDHKARFVELKRKSDSAFDAAYAAAMAKANEMAVALFREASVAPDVDGSLQSFAKKTLPTLEEHSSTAKQLHAGLSAMARSNKS